MSKLTRSEFVAQLSAMVMHINDLGAADGDPWAELKVSRIDEDLIGRNRIEMHSCSVDALCNADLILEESRDGWLIIDSDSSKYGFNHRATQYNCLGKPETAEWIVESVKIWYDAWCDEYEVPPNKRCI